MPCPSRTGPSKRESCSVSSSGAALILAWLSNSRAIILLLPRRISLTNTTVPSVSEMCERDPVGRLTGGQAQRRRQFRKE